MSIFGSKQRIDTAETSRLLWAAEMEEHKKREEEFRQRLPDETDVDYDTRMLVHKEFDGRFHEIAQLQSIQRELIKQRVLLWNILKHLENRP